MDKTASERKAEEKRVRQLRKKMDAITIKDLRKAVIKNPLGAVIDPDNEFMVLVARDQAMRDLLRIVSSISTFTSQDGEALGYVHEVLQKETGDQNPEKQREAELGLSVGSVMQDLPDNGIDIIFDSKADGSQRKVMVAASGKAAERIYELLEQDGAFNTKPENAPKVAQA